MIIECQACRARFKLDESRIKGKGARIRCRKCGESIIVMKSETQAQIPSAPIEKELFDLRSILREPERRAPVPPREEVDAASERPLQTEQEPEPETIAKEPAEPLRVTASDLGEEVDAAFDRLLDRDREREVAAQEPVASDAESPPSPAMEIDAPFESSRFQEQEGGPEPPSMVAEAPAPAEPEPEPAPRESAEPFAEVPPPPPEEVDDSFDTPLFGEEEPRPPPINGETIAVDLPEPSGEDALVATTPGEEVPETGRTPAEFLILDTDSSDILRKESSLGEPARPFDISEQLIQAPRWTLEVDTAPTPPSPETSPSTGVPTDLRAETIQDELAGLAGRDLREELFAPEPPPPDLPPPQPPETKRKRLMVPPRAIQPSRRPSVMILALLLLTLAGGGAYLAFTKSGQETLRAILPGMESFWLGGRESARPYKVENPIGFYETGKGAEKLFVIKGAITNQGRSAKSGIRVRAELLDGNRKSIGEMTVYAGNVIPGLRSENRESIQAAMSNRFGDKLSNVDVAPGKSVPFMVVFIDPPEGIEEYRLEALEGE